MNRWFAFQKQTTGLYAIIWLEIRRMWTLWIVSFSLFSGALACEGDNCSSCITSDGSCAWCTQGNFEVSAYRCNTVEKLEENGCRPENIVAPNNTINNTRDLDVTDGINGTESVQIQPQVVRLKLRPNSKVSIPLTFRAANDYPVDLYFLFDLSHTMKSHKDKLATLAEKLAKEISSISSNFRMGFGYFQDKVILPFTSTVPAKLKNPCNSDQCAPPFGYRHQLKLTREVPKFVQAVTSARVTGNIDVPEGGLDAIMQAVVCEGEIGWRPRARRLIIYSSDTTYHHAGDGRLAGIVIPNDGKCHLDANGTNPEELYQDYPSVGQIAQKVGAHNVNIIFAILAKVEDIYKKLSKRITGSSVDVLNSKSSNVVDIVRKKYKEIISEVELNVVGTPGVIVELKSDCNGLIKRTTNKCDGLSIGKKVVFDVEVLATSCPADPDKREKTVKIHPVGLLEEMVIEIELQCECSCEQPGMEEVNSTRCSDGQGTFECGVCSCNEGRYGKTCECSRFDISSGERRQACVPENKTVVCMGRGDCECGRCDCRHGYSGKFCECNNNACEKLNGLLCGGPVHGRCVCGECQCNADYIGSKCECSLREDACTDAGGIICSGQGKCVCGKCKCEGGRFGKLCETCPTCPGVCADNRACAECTAFDENLSREECAEKCSHVRIVDELETEDGDNVCRVKDADGCDIVFRLVYHEDGNTTMLVLKDKVCPKPVALLPIIGGVIGGILAVGLLLLILWKLLTTVFDGIEYARFKEEINTCQWARQDNPIYKGATSTFNNPMMEERVPLKTT